MDELLETIDETMETSYSQAFSDFQRQRALGTTRISRSQSAEGFQTPMQGDMPLHATIRSIAEEVASQADRRAAAINPPFEDPPEDDDQPAGVQNDATPLKHMQVPKHMFEKISAFHFSQVEKFKITNSGTDQGQRWINLKSVFDQIDLQTLFLGVRTPPVSNRIDNAYGHTEGYKTVYENISYTVAADDVNKYSYDVRKLFGLMVPSFDTDYPHISQDGFLQRDGYIIYQDAKRHFEGHEAKDVLFHHQNLQQFTPNPKITFKADAVSKKIIFSDVSKKSHASHLPTSTSWLPSSLNSVKTGAPVLSSASRQ
jgi:hypothetical protein